VVLIMGFQMLSAVESQWLDFLVYDGAAHRYSTTTALAQFVGRFSAAQYGADIVFLLVFAGLLLRRFGLRYGLTANPGVVLTTVVLGAWLIVAIVIYGDYQVNLLASLRHRLLEPADLAADGAHTFPVIDRLLTSDDPRDIRLGMSALRGSNHDELVRRLEQL